ncbi:MAG: hypothetical protein ACPLX7_03915 [Candidatus Kapaibacteriota bacterium]|jgi:hypothetical protein
MSRNGNFLTKTILLVFLTSCIIVKEKIPDKEFSTDFTILQKPSIQISDEAIRAERGDMIAFLPVGWFLVDTEDKAPSNVFAVSVDPDYTLSIVFSRLTNKIDVQNILKNQGLLGIATKCFEIKQLKSVNNIRLVGNFEPIKNGSQKFYVYKYENIVNKLIGKSAVFVSALNEVYEFSLVQINIKEKQTISNQEFDKVFYSVLSTIKY